MRRIGFGPGESLVWQCRRQAQRQQEPQDRVNQIFNEQISLRRGQPLMKGIEGGSSLCGLIIGA
jgi:hypothetical protein